MMADQEKREKEAKEKMKQRTEALAAEKKTKKAVENGTTTVAGQSLARVLDINERENMKYGNPETIVLGEKRTDWDAHKK